MRAVTLSAAALAIVAAATSSHAACVGSACVKDFPIAYPNKGAGSTHEITYNHNGGETFWITAPTYNAVVEVALSGAQKQHPQPSGSGPHGIAFDAAGQLYVSFETGQAIVRLNPATGGIEARYPVYADPHGLGIGPDGKTVWFTGKMKNTVGKLLPNGAAVNFLLPTASALPIYIAAGPDGNMWFTELTGNKIGRVSPDGAISEFRIPTDNSRPIAIVPEPGGQAMWFSQEAGNKVARIDMRGAITEFAVPKSQKNVILAGLAFDADGNLWVQQYVDQNHPNPPGPDHIIKIGSSILKAKPGDKLDFTSYQVPTRKTVMHRIIQGPDKNVWFTELKADRVGRVDIGGATAMK